MTGLTVSLSLEYPSEISGCGDGIKKAYFLLTEQFFLQNKLTMLFLLTRLLGFLLAVLCHGSYQQALQ